MLAGVRGKARIAGARGFIRSTAEQSMSFSRAFNDLSCTFAKAAGSPLAFVLAATTVLIWAVSGPLFHFSETWQLVINTGTTIVTFLMVFLIQNAQNRDAEALQLKLDEIIFAISTADNSMIDIEKLDQESLDMLRRKYEHVLTRAEKRGDA
jgi:low affinity Fe/Cu permease